MPVEDLVPQGRAPWLAGEPPSSLLLVLVSGLDGAEALRRAGADVTQPPPDEHDGRGARPGLGGRDVEGPSPGAVLVGDTYPGDLGELVRVLSSRGAAACVAWEADDMVLVACARRSRPAFVAEVGDDPDSFPRALRALARQALADGDPRELAVAMVQRHTGMALDGRTGTDVGPRHPVTRPTLGLQVSADELVGLDLPTPGLVRDVRASEDRACRRLAAWACRSAVREAGFQEEPAVSRALGGADGGRAVGADPALARLRAEVRTATFEAESALSGSEPSRGALALAASWSTRYWALEALAYLASEDGVTAALGATYCASVRFADDPGAERDFVDEATQVLLSEG